MTLVEITAQDALHVANGYHATIKALHASNVPRYQQQFANATNRDERSTYAMYLLQISFGLATLAVRAVYLEEAASNKVYAQKYWTKIATFN
jgi:hypothetical protein